MSENLPEIRNLDPDIVPRIEGIYITDIQPIATALVAFGVAEEELGEWAVHTNKTLVKAASEEPDRVVALSPVSVQANVTRRATASRLDRRAASASLFKEEIAPHILEEIAVATDHLRMTRIRAGMETRGAENITSITGLIAGFCVGRFGFEADYFIVNIGCALVGSHLTEAVRNRWISVRPRAKKLSKEFIQENPKVVADITQVALPVYSRSKKSE